MKSKIRLVLIVVALLLVAGWAFVTTHAGISSGGGSVAGGGAVAPQAPTDDESAHRDSGAALAPGTAQRKQARPEQEMRVRGEVLWKDGSPVIGASVTLSSHSPANEPTRTETDAVGRFELDVSPADAPKLDAEGKLGLCIQPKCWQRPWTGSAKATASGATLDVANIRLPNEIDIKLAVDTGAALAGFLAEHGGQSFQLRVTESTTNSILPLYRTLGELEVPISKLETSKVIRIPYRPTVRTVLFLRAGQLAPGDSAWGNLVEMPRSKPFHLTRTRENAIRVKPTRSQFLLVWVLDQSGTPLPDAILDFHLKNPRLPTGYTNDVKSTGVHGYKIYAGDPTRALRIDVDYAGVKKQIDGIVPAQGVVRIHLDLKKQVSLAPTLHGHAINAFDVRYDSLFFGIAPPSGENRRLKSLQLPIHTNGRCYLPMQVGGEAESRYLVWRDGQRLHEALYRITPDKPVITVDVASLEEKPRGSFHFVFDETIHRLHRDVDLERVDPPTPEGTTRIWILVQPGVRTHQFEQTVIGAPPGRYRIRINGPPSGPMPAALFNNKPLLELFRDMHGQRIDINVKKLAFGK